MKNAYKYSYRLTNQKRRKEGIEMKNRRKMVALLLACAMTAGLCACGSKQDTTDKTDTSAKEETVQNDADSEGGDADTSEWPENPDDVYELSVGVTIAQNTPSGEALLAIDEELRERSNGAVGLDIYWDSTLGGATELAEGVTTGTMDIALISSAVISNYTPSIDVLSLPFIINDRDQMKALIDNNFDEMTAGMDSTVGIPLGIWELGYRHLCTREKEVKTLEDCEGLTIRVMDGQVYTATFNALGCIPTNVATSELVTALQQGMVDGVEEPYSMIVGQQQYSFCKYVAMIGYNYSVACPVLSSITADTLPENVIALVEEVFNDYRFYTIDRGAEAEEEYIATCEDAGMTINYLDDDEMAKFRDAVAPIWEEYSDTIGKELIDTVANISY